MYWLFQNPIVTVTYLNVSHAQSNSRKRPKKIKLLQMNFILKKQLKKFFMYLLAPFILQNFKKFLEPIQSYEDAPFLDPKWSICPEQKFSRKTINIILIYLLAPFIEKSLKKILPADPELWGYTVFGSKMAHFPKWEFFSENLLMSLVSFIHTYLHAKNQSQILIY